MTSPIVRGYLSEEHKRTFTITTGILGALFFIGQVVLPVIIMLALMPAMMFSQMDAMKTARLERGAFWNGEIWYVEQSLGGPTSPGNAVLKKLVVGSDQEPVTVAEPRTENPWLLAGDDRLWIVSSSGIGWYDNEEFTFEPGTRQLADISRPFLYEGRPAVIEQTPSGLALLVFEQGDWQTKQALALKRQDSSLLRQKLQVVPEGPSIHFFLQFGSTLYHRKGFPEEPEDVRDSWQIVSMARDPWYATSIDGRPMVFRCRGDEGFTSGVLGFSLTERGWAESFSYETPVFGQMAVFPMENERFALVTQSFPGALRVIETGGPQAARETRYGRGFPFPRGMIPIMFIPHLTTLLMPLILAFVLSPMMRKHRVCQYESATSRMPFASLGRRALAQIVDAVLIGLPAIAAWLLMMRVVFDFERMFTRQGLTGMLAGFGLIAVAFAWAIMCFFVFSFLEGKYGRTPGKWITGIKVLGSDLKPCGFGRALVRNLLKFVDGFFNFMVGVMVVALTENWQRVGDMAARTVVVDVRDTARVSTPE